MAAGAVSLMPRWQTSKPVLVFAKKKKILLEASDEGHDNSCSMIQSYLGRTGVGSVIVNTSCFCSAKHSGAKGPYPSIGPLSPALCEMLDYASKTLLACGSHFCWRDHRWLQWVSEIKNGHTERTWKVTRRHVWLNLSDSGFGSSFLSQAALFRDTHCLQIRAFNTLNLSPPFPFLPSSVSIPTSYPHPTPMRHG